MADRSHICHSRDVGPIVHIGVLANFRKHLCAHNWTKSESVLTHKKCIGFRFSGKRIDSGLQASVASLNIVAAHSGDLRSALNLSSRQTVVPDVDFFATSTDNAYAACTTSANPVTEAR